jgi:hypothetical protein
MNNNCISQKITVFQERVALEDGLLVGYRAIISHKHG